MSLRKRRREGQVHFEGGNEGLRRTGLMLKFAIVSGGARTAKLIIKLVCYRKTCGGRMPPGEWVPEKDLQAFSPFGKPLLSPSTLSSRSTLRIRNIAILSPGAGGRTGRRSQNEGTRSTARAINRFQGNGKICTIPNDGSIQRCSGAL